MLLIISLKGIDTLSSVPDIGPNINLYKPIIEKKVLYILMMFDKIFLVIFLLFPIIVNIVSNLQYKKVVFDFKPVVSTATSLIGYALLLSIRIFFKTIWFEIVS